MTDVLTEPAVVEAASEELVAQAKSKPYVSQLLPDGRPVVDAALTGRPARMLDLRRHRQGTDGAPVESCLRPQRSGDIKRRTGSCCWCCS